MAVFACGNGFAPSPRCTARRRRDGKGRRLHGRLLTQCVSRVTLKNPFDLFENMSRGGGPMAVLTDRHIDFIKGQPLFFVGTAAADGRVNISPKGLDSLRVLDGDRIVWLNLSGSGNETAAHLAEHDRITMMFAAFQGHAKILRVYGHGRVVHPRDAGWDELIGLFPDMPGSRQIIDVTVESVLQSCGSGVPKFDLAEDRGPSELLPFYEKMGEDGVRRYWEKKNVVSIDGKPTHIFDD
ncbi:MAG: pyridoxamine 5'-phosphate oxidase family protein [Alphaproteobacteria bacterium]